MKREKIYDFAIDSPLTSAKRKLVEKHIAQNAHLSPNPISYSWDGDNDQVLHIEAAPLLIEVSFQTSRVELYATAPLWARLLFTKQRKAELKGQIESILQKAKFVTATKPKLQRAKLVAARKPSLPKTKSAAAKKSKR